MKELLDETAFREYDVRGTYNKQLDETTAYKIGLAFGTKLKELKKSECVIGHDNRLSSEALTKSLLKGIKETGVNIKYLGLVTTPMYYFACLYLKIDSGIMVTASHNPKEDNGFKICFENYDNACGETIKDLYELCLNGPFEKGYGIIEMIDIKDAYQEEVLSHVNITKPLKVVIDPANGTTSIIVKDIFDKVGITPYYINAKSDGNFPNHHPDPSVYENLKELKEKVQELNADVGIALDGDGDRVGIVDEQGNIISVDILMAIFARSILPKSSNKTILFDVKCSRTLEEEIIKADGTPFMYRTGNSYQKNKIKELDLSFGGELSGHVFFRDKWKGFDDGVYAGLRFIEIMSKTGKTASELYKDMTIYENTPEIKIAVKEEEKDVILEKIKSYVLEKNYKYRDIDGIRIELPYGWALVRKSNTGPNLTLRFEADTKDHLENLQKEIMKLIED